MSTPVSMETLIAQWRRERIDLEPIKARAIAATIGPWTNGIRGSGSMGDAHMCRIIARGHETAQNPNIAGATIGMTWHPEHVVSYVGLSRQACIDNAEFMAHAREDVPSLVAEIERLRRCADELAAHLHAQPVARQLLRTVWERGIQIAIGYGDNVHHLQGAQADRIFDKLMIELAAPSPSVPVDDIEGEPAPILPGRNPRHVRISIQPPSVSAPPARMQELAREQAFVKHAHFVLMPHTQGHVQGMGDTEWGFSACPHPDCVLVRVSAPPAQAPTDDEDAVSRVPDGDSSASSSPPRSPQRAESDH